MSGDDPAAEGGGERLHRGVTGAVGMIVSGIVLALTASKLSQSPEECVAEAEADGEAEGSSGASACSGMPLGALTAVAVILILGGFVSLVAALARIAKASSRNSPGMLVSQDGAGALLAPQAGNKVHVAPGHGAAKAPAAAAAAAAPPPPSYDAMVAQLEHEYGGWLDQARGVA